MADQNDPRTAKGDGSHGPATGGTPDNTQNPPAAPTPMPLTGPKDTPATPAKAAQPVMTPAQPARPAVKGPEFPDPVSPQLELKPGSVDTPIPQQIPRQPYVPNANKKLHQVKFQSQEEERLVKVNGRGEDTQQAKDAKK